MKKKQIALFVDSGVLKRFRQKVFVLDNKLRGSYGDRLSEAMELFLEKHNSINKEWICPSCDLSNEFGRETCSNCARSRSDWGRDRSSPLRNLNNDNTSEVR